jgi:parvulin-like peptidyl-prolyl isomerase
LWTPTPTFTPEPTLANTEGITPTATPADTPTPGPTATLNVIGADALATQYTEWLNTIAEQTGLDEATYRSYIRAVVLGDKLGDALGEETPRIAEQTNARHILVETEEEANDALARLEAGEEFADLASELSTDPGSAAQGGELGFVPAGTFVPAIDEAVFSLPVGQISDPIETQFGWHIVEVLEREEQELSPSNYSQAQRQAYSDWLTEARQAATIEDLWTADMAPADPLLGQ